MYINVYFAFNVFYVTLNCYNMVITAGLIIDAFGELRDQQEQVKEDMEVHCNVVIVN